VAAYDAADRLRRFGLTTMMVREQYHDSWRVAAAAAFHLARAALRFHQLQSNADGIARNLEAAYARAQSWLHADFDPAAVARADLAWRVASRTAGANGAEHAADLFTDEYALLYSTPRDLGAEAAQLRAEAAALRDVHAGAADRGVSTTTAERLSSGIAASVEWPQAWSRRGVGVESIAWRRIHPQTPRHRRR
jgi:hypothetical protein